MGRLPRAFVFLLLLVQAWIGVTRGDGVCIAWGDCEPHAHAAAAAPGTDGSAPGSVRTHHHGPAPDGTHDHADDDDHAHVPAVAEELAPVAPRAPLPPTALPSPPWDAYLADAVRGTIARSVALRVSPQDRRAARPPDPSPTGAGHGPVLAFRV